MVLACMFFSIALAAVVGRKMLVTALVVWLAAGLAFGFLDTKPLDGLYLFERTTRIEKPGEFTTIVETYRHTEDAVEEPGSSGLVTRLVAGEVVEPRRVVIKADPILDEDGTITGDVTEEIEVDRDAPPPGPLFRVGVLPTLPTCVQPPAMCTTTGSGGSWTPGRSPLRREYR